MTDARRQRWLVAVPQLFHPSVHICLIQQHLQAVGMNVEDCGQINEHTAHKHFKYSLVFLPDFLFILQ